MKDGNKQLVLKFLRRKAYPDLMHRFPVSSKADWVCVWRDSASMTWVATFSGKAPQVDGDGCHADGKDCVLVSQDRNIGLSWLRSPELVEAIESAEHRCWVFPMSEVWRKKWASA